MGSQGCLLAGYLGGLFGGGVSLRVQEVVERSVDFCLGFGVRFLYLQSKGSVGLGGLEDRVFLVGKLVQFVFGRNLCVGWLQVMFFNFAGT